MKILYIKNFDIAKYFSNYMGDIIGDYVATRTARGITVNIFSPDYPSLHDDLEFCIVNKITKKSAPEMNDWVLCKIKKEKITEYGNGVLVTQAFVGVKFTGDENMMTQFEKNIKSFMLCNFPESYI